MQYLILGIAFGLCLFILPVVFYRLGVRDGMGVAKGVPPEPFKGPVAAVKERRAEAEEQKKQDEFITGIANLFSYDGTPQKKEVDK